MPILNACSQPLVFETSLDPRAIHQYVDAAVARNHLFRDLLPIRQHRHIVTKEFPFHFRRERLPCSFGYVGKDNFGTFKGQESSARCADTAGASSNDHYLVFYSHVASSAYTVSLQEWGRCVRRCTIINQAVETLPLRRPPAHGNRRSDDQQEFRSTLPGASDARRNERFDRVGSNQNSGQDTRRQTARRGHCKDSVCRSDHSARGIRRVDAARPTGVVHARRALACRGDLEGGCGTAGTRTQDQSLKRALLYQLSYRPMGAAHYS